ncbi:MAG: hypothetical protein PVH24_01230, partial [Candidatus Zixiibacteriota bacterium]
MSLGSADIVTTSGIGYQLNHSLGGDHEVGPSPARRVAASSNGWVFHGYTLSYGEFAQVFWGGADLRDPLPGLEWFYGTMVVEYGTLWPQVDVGYLGQPLVSYQIPMPYPAPYDAKIVYDSSLLWESYLGWDWSDTLPQNLSIYNNGDIFFPKVAYQYYGGEEIIHVAVVEQDASLQPYLTYWRRVLNGTTWTTDIITDSITRGSCHHSIAASRNGNGNVAIAWTRPRDMT